MAKGDRQMLSRVSYHAVIGYVRSALGCAVFSDSTVSDRESATMHAAAVGLTVAHVRALILTPTVELGLKLGAIHVRNDRLNIHLRRDNGVMIVGAVSKAVSDRPPMRESRDNQGDARRYTRRRSVAEKRKPSPYMPEVGGA